MNLFRREKPVLFLATPTRGEPLDEFVMSRDRIVNWAFHAKQRGLIAEFWRGFRRGSDIGMNRCELVADARRHKATHLLFLDDDMSFPEDTAARLLAHGRDIVGCNYPTREMPLRFTAGALEQDPEAGRLGAPYRYVQTGADSTGLEPAAFVGMGCCLIHMRAFDVIDRFTGRPGAWFVLPREDVIFCSLARRAGLTVWVDHDLSKELRHFGRFGFTCAHVGMEVFNKG